MTEMGVFDFAMQTMKKDRDIKEHEFPRATMVLSRPEKMYQSKSLVSGRILARKQSVIAGRSKDRKTNGMNIKDKTILITGANRGIGRALLEEALKRGVKQVYAGTRQSFTHSDSRVVPLTLDITDPNHIQAAAKEVESLDLLINNAGRMDPRENLNDRVELEGHLDVNLFGTYAVSQAFLPAVERSHGAILNVLSLASLASLPFSPGYSISKAAALSLTQSLRALWARRGVKVHAVIAGAVDTDMTKNLDIPKASPDSVAVAIFDGLQKGDEEIFPDPGSEPVAEGWRNGAAKALERQFAAFVPPEDAKVA